MIEHIDWNAILEYRDGALYWRETVNRRIIKGRRAGTLYTNGYRNIQFRGRRFSEHRVVWEIHNGAIPHELQIDHINRTKGDNHIENLRLVTKSQNCINKGLARNNSSGHTGVAPDNSRPGLWRADLVLKDGKRWRKRYRTFEEAVEAHRQKMEEVYPGIRS